MRAGELAKKIKDKEAEDAKEGKLGMVGEECHRRDDFEQLMVTTATIEGWVNHERAWIDLALWRPLTQ